jgi:hypothetical protein
MKIADEHDNLNWLNGQNITEPQPGKVIPIYKIYVFVQISNPVIQYTSHLLKS